MSQFLSMDVIRSEGLIRIYSKHIVSTHPTRQDIQQTYRFHAPYKARYTANISFHAPYKARYTANISFPRTLQGEIYSKHIVSTHPTRRDIQQTYRFHAPYKARYTANISFHAPYKARYTANISFPRTLQGEIYSKHIVSTHPTRRDIQQTYRFHAPYKARYTANISFPRTLQGEIYSKHIVSTHPKRRDRDNR